ncbi:MAG: cell envelope integrity protein TolA [Desulfosalsimonas sp.]|uniref:cell envelope integrity protein TolA n=1 Tax=Desulfosalsimonas sp. TaxID=3073848 RepID=UPI003970625E
MSGKISQSQSMSGYRQDLPPFFWATCFGVSLLIHLALLGALVFSPFGENSPRINPSETINVDLVGFNPEIPAPPGEASSEDASSSQEAEPLDDAELSEQDQASADSGEEEMPKARPIPVKTGSKKKVAADYDLVEPESEPSVKTSLKKKTLDSRKVIEDAVRRLSEKSRDQRPKSLQDRIAEMENQVGDLAGGGRVSGGDSDRAGTGTASNKDYSSMEIYQAEVAVKMKRNWAFSSELAGGGRGLETRLVIKILPDGTIADVWYEKRSGNAYLDESAYKTVMKANPLPPLPKDYPHYHLMLGFTPSGLAQ